MPGATQDSSAGQTGPPTCLFVTRSLPFPPDSGSRLRAFQVLKGLRRYCELHVVAGDGDPQAARNLARLLGATVQVADSSGPAERCRDLVIALRRRTPVAMARHHNGSLQRLATQTLRHSRIDFAVVQSVHLGALAAGLTSVPVVMDFENVEGQIWQRYAAFGRRPLRPLLRYEGRRLIDYQRRLTESASAVMCVSDLDAQTVRHLTAEGDIVVVPNTVEVPRCIPDRKAAGGALFVGSLDWFANLDGLRWFDEEVWPRVVARVPDRSFQIVGRSSRAGSLHLSAPQTRYLGPVRDLGPAYRNAAVVVVPVRVGGGTRLKILEAFAHGVPVVSTSLGAEGLMVQDGVHLMLSDSPAAMAESIELIMRDARYADRLRASAFELVRRHYSDEAVVDALGELPPLRRARESYV
jgi:glycosyltransferase involved in cell wall biosynthesis